MNNGFFIVVSPTGKILFTSDFRQSGGYVVEVPLHHHSRGSFFSRYPLLFHTILLFMWIIVLWKSVMERDAKFKAKIGDIIRD
ncbi:hypothetical protein [uncultured Shewanella sp.]|uniref:hypothetical protein n=1 Tax=uncultured Shewanella sp. TaxID=173975 RepID=UPI00261A65A7|nr:hypothetical protein [uncultured Shewanella sp.]